MNSRNSFEIDLAAFNIYKKSRRESLKIDLPTLKEEDIELRLIGEWDNMTEKEKFPFFKIIEDNPRLLETTCQASRAHNKYN